MRYTKFKYAMEELQNQTDEIVSGADSETEENIEMVEQNSELQEYIAETELENAVEDLNYLIDKHTALEELKVLVSKKQNHSYTALESYAISLALEEDTKDAKAKNDKTIGDRLRETGKRIKEYIERIVASVKEKLTQFWNFITRKDKNLKKEAEQTIKQAEDQGITTVPSSVADIDVEKVKVETEVSKILLELTPHVLKSAKDNKITTRDFDKITGTYFDKIVENKQEDVEYVNYVLKPNHAELISKYVAISIVVKDNTVTNISFSKNNNANEENTEVSFKDKFVAKFKPVTEYLEDLRSTIEKVGVFNIIKNLYIGVGAALGSSLAFGVVGLAVSILVMVMGTYLFIKRHVTNAINWIRSKFKSDNKDKNKT